MCIDATVETQTGARLNERLTEHFGQKRYSQDPI